MSSKAKSTKAAAAEAPEAVIQNALGETESFFEKNWKLLSIVFAVIIVIVGGWFMYKGLYVKSRGEKAAAAMYVAEQQFQAEQWDAALNGDGTAAGFLEIIKNYGVTREANLAKYYAALCYLKMGDTANAAMYLAKYKPTKGVPNSIINAQCYGLQADLKVNDAQYDDAIALYKKAIKAADNIMTTPTYLKKLGEVYVKTGDLNAALTAFQTISDKYPGSLEGRDADKYIGEVQQLLNSK